MKNVLLLIFVIAAVSISFVTYNKYFEITKNIEIFSNVYKELNNAFVDEVDPSKLMKTGIDAMLKSLDPYTVYYSESQIENYRLTTEGKYNGIGAKVKKIGDFVTITEVHHNYPAFKAGLKAGDQITKVNGRDAKGKETEELYNIMRGSPKSEVELDIFRPGQGNMEINLVRDEVNIPNVPFSGFAAEDIGYFTLTQFTQDAGKNVWEAIKKLKAEKPDMKGIIFDLRDNGGGLLGEAIRICNAFLPKDVQVVSTRSKVKERDNVFRTTQEALDQNIPVVVLINKYSASASEIVSGVLQDMDRAVIMGQISYGKGLVQNTKQVGYNAQIKLTTSKYYIPSGRCIQSVKYENGEPVHLPDSLREVFKTKNGRKVLDGGGIKPDVSLASAEYPEIVQKLIDQDLLFKFCTEYQISHDKPKEISTFSFTDMPAFFDFVKNSNFDYISPLEKVIVDAKKVADQEKANQVSDQFLQIKQQLDQQQETELKKHSELLQHLITEDILSREFYEEGKMKKKLLYDPVIKEAIQLLHDPIKYNSILAKQ